MKVVVDANVFVSAAIRTGPPHRIVQAWLERRDFEVVICPAFHGLVEHQRRVHYSSADWPNPD